MKKSLLLFALSAGLGIYSYLLQWQGKSDSSWSANDYNGPLSGMRNAFLRAISGIDADSTGLVAGLAIGETKLLSAAAKEQLQVVSLTHLTAVSGANCAIIVGLTYLLLRRVPIHRIFRISLSLAALVFYVLLVGPEPSVLRASVMAAVVMVSLALGRKVGATQALALCVIILLIADPWLAGNFGFQLSVAATLGILEIAPELTKRFERRLPTWLSLALGVAIAAQIMCLPILLQLQPGLSTYSVPANLVAEPLVAPITVLGIISCLVAPIAPAIATAFSWLASLGAWVIIQTANFFATAPTATINWFGGITGVIFAIIVILALVLWLRSQRAASRFVGATIVAGVIAVTFGGCVAQTTQNARWPPSDWDIAACDVGQGDATVVQSEGLTALIDVGRDNLPIDRCLDRLGINQIDLLVLTHFDMDHVGGLDGAIGQRKVARALITGFLDNRPAVSAAYRKLRSAVGEVLTAETGMFGSLGAFSWRVLSPHVGATEVENSNDGSVTMLFSSPSLIFIALADMGERGQRRLIAESAGWLGRGFGDTSVVVKVSHHGSTDQYSEFYEALKPDLALISAGVDNSYGHPTQPTLRMLRLVGASVLRTDQDGNLALLSSSEGLRVWTSG